MCAVFAISDAVLLDPQTWTRPLAIVGGKEEVRGRGIQRREDVRGRKGGGVSRGLK